jgi:hypothetical protein
LVDSWVAEEAATDCTDDYDPGIPGSPSCSRCVICNLKRSNVRIVSICNHDVATGLPGPRAGSISSHCRTDTPHTRQVMLY